MIFILILITVLPELTMYLVIRLVMALNLRSFLIKYKNTTRFLVVFVFYSRRLIKLNWTAWIKLITFLYMYPNACLVCSQYKNGWMFEYICARLHRSYVATTTSTKKTIDVKVVLFILIIELYCRILIIKLDDGIDDSTYVLSKNIGAITLEN